MKKYLLFLFFLFLYSGTYSQSLTFERSFQPGYLSEFRSVVSDTAGNWYAAGFYKESVGLTYSYISSYDTSGNTLWEISFPDSFGDSYITDMIRTSDDHLILSGNSRVCDVGGEYVYLKKIDLNGTVVWMNYSSEISGIWLPHTRVIESFDGGFWQSADTLLFKRDASGDSVFAVSLLHGSPLTLLEDKWHRLLAGSEEGITILDSAGNQLNFYPYLYGIQKILQLDDSSYVAASGPDVLFLTPGFITSSSWNLATDFYSISDIRRTGNAYRVMGKKALLKNPLVESFDTTGQIFQVFDFGDSLVQAEDIAVFTNKFAIVGRETAGGSTTMWIRNYLTSGFGDHFPSDASVIDIRYDTAYAVHAGGPPQNHNLYFETEVTVKNFGLDTLRSFYINARLNATGVCGFLTYQELIDSVMILPGGSRAYNIGLLMDSFWCGGACTVTYCFWTSCPNNHVDKKHDNDSLCEPLTVQVPVGLNEPEKASFDILPNPATGYFMITGIENQIDKLEIFNSAGALVLEQHAGIVADLAVPIKFPKGLYFVRLITRDHTLVQKLIVD